MSNAAHTWEAAPFAFYVGSIAHVRLRPVQHRFRYRCFFALLDLDAPSAARRFSRFFSFDRPNLMSIYERDHLPREAGETLLQRARNAFEARGVDVREARIQLLALPRVCGYAFNPISVFYAIDAAGRLIAALYEVRNTFGERWIYAAAAAPGRSLGGHEIAKAFHVSPFLPMRLRYRFRTDAPGDRAALRIVETDTEGVILTAVFAGERVKATDANVIRLFFSLPFATLKVILGIHWEALRLLGKGLKVYPHPSRGRRPEADQPSAPPRS